MATTLKDVAQLAQVSVKTVSNVVHDHPHVSKDVRRRVETAIQQLDYRPNLAARALRNGRSGLLALVVPRVGASHTSGLVEAIIWQAAPLGFRVVIAPPESSLTGQDAAGRFVEEPGADAVLLHAEAPPAELVQALRSAGTPLVLITGYPDARYDCVGPDAARAVHDATEHLTRSGRRRIAVIGASNSCEAVRRVGLGLPVPYARLAPGCGPSEGYAAARQLLAHGPRPDAILCDSDRPAAGVIRAVADEGLRVPEDVAVITLGDSEDGRYLRPTVTTVATDPAFIARHALDLVVRRLANRTAPPAQIIASHVVLARESTTAATAEVHAR